MRTNESVQAEIVAGMRSLVRLEGGGPRDGPGVRLGRRTGIVSRQPAQHANCAYGVLRACWDPYSGSLYASSGFAVVRLSEDGSATYSSGRRAPWRERTARRRGPGGPLQSASIYARKSFRIRRDACTPQIANLKVCCPGYAGCSFPPPGGGQQQLPPRPVARDGRHHSFRSS